MLNKYLRLTVITNDGRKLSSLINVMHIVSVIEHPQGADNRPTAEVFLHGGVMFKTQETVEEITRLINLPDSMSGPVINPQETF